MKGIRYIAGVVILAGALLYIIAKLPSGVLAGVDCAYAEFIKRAFAIILVSAFLCLFRILRGPTPSDRIVSIDMLGILIIGICCLLSIATRRSWYIDIGIAWALQSFISTLALSKFLEGKNFDE